MDAKKLVDILIGPWALSDEAIRRKKQWQLEQKLLLRKKFGLGLPTTSSVEWAKRFYKKKK